MIADVRKYGRDARWIPDQVGNDKPGKTASSKA